MTTLLLELPGTLMVALGIYGKFVAGNAFHSFLNEMANVNYIAGCGCGNHDLGQLSLDFAFS